MNEGETWECKLDGEEGRWMGARVYVFHCVGLEDALSRVNTFMTVVNAAMDG